MYAPQMDDLGHTDQTAPTKTPPFREDPHGIVQFVKGLPLLGSGHWFPGWWLTYPSETYQSQMG